MRLSPPTLRQLEIFLDVVAHGSFRTTAKNMGVTQVAISDAIRQMEKRIGQPLFYRQAGESASLTPAGTRCNSHAERIVAESRALMAAMESSQTDPEAAIVAPAKSVPPPPSPRPAPHPTTRTVTIATHPSIFSHFREQLGQFEIDHPETALALDMDIFTVTAVADAFDQERADMAYFYALGDSLAFPSDYLWIERLALFVGEEHPLAQREYVGLVDLALVQPVHFGPRNRLRPLMEEALDAAGLGAAPIAMESDDYGTVLAHLRSGEGFFALFGPLARDFGQMSGIHRLPFVDHLPAIEVRRAIRPGLYNDPVLQNLTLALS